MRRTISVPSLVAVLAGVLAGGLFTTSVLYTATASTPATCSKMHHVSLVGSVEHEKWSQCTQTPATGGSGTATIKTSGSPGTFKVTWNRAGSTTTGTYTANFHAKPNNCPNGQRLVIWSGSVTGGTGAALKAIPKGSTYKEALCFSGVTVKGLRPGTKIVI